MGILSFFILISMGIFNLSYADSAKDRCRTTDCTCLIRKGVVPIPVSGSTRIERRQIIYFNEGSSVLSSAQVSSIISFTRSSSKNISVTLMGHTDGCGSKEYNTGLSARRASEVRDIIKSVDSNIRINVVTGGERVQYHSSQARRVDIIFHTENQFTTRIEQVPADVYLVDGSGSMWESRSEWIALVNASFRPGSRIYMSMMTGCYNGQKLDTISPQGGTEIWYSYYTVINKMENGETLLIISDFDSNFPILPWERETIEGIVRRKNISVLTVSP